MWKSLACYYIKKSFITGSYCYYYYSNSYFIAVGNVINVETAQWAGKMSGLGAGLDSFYEYLLKVSIGTKLRLLQN